MKKLYPFIVSLLFSCLLLGQEKSLLDYDGCKDGISKSLLKKYEKAVSYFNDKKYSQASSLLQEVIKEDESFASPYFLMGMIGVVKDNTTMIMKYFPLVKENCPEFSHPYLFYYLGMIDYTEERYSEASKNFEHFLTLTDQNNFYDSLQKIAINYIGWSDFLKTTMENKVAFDPKKINFLAKNKNYYEPFVTWDKGEIWFIREEVIKDTNYDSFFSEVSTHKNRYLQRSIFDSTGFYDKGFIAPDPFNNQFPLSGVSITADNNYIFFSVKNNTEDNKSWDIYYCERIDDYFSNAKSININTTASDEFSPSVSADGNLLYFVSDRPGGKGGYDIWFCKRTGKDTWSEPENLGRNVNTFGNETYPFIAADNSHLYFLSNGRRTLGGNDIFVYDIKKDLPARNIGYPVNTESNENPVCIGLDGKTAYSIFKNKDNKFQEINQFALDDRFRSDERILINGIVEKTLNGDIYLNLTSTDGEENTPYYISNEHPDFTLIIRKDKEYILTLDQNGYMFYVAKVNAETQNLVIEQKPLESGTCIQLNCVKLDGNGLNFDDNSQNVLDNFVSFLKRHTRIRINITAEKKMNDALKNYLIKSGIREDRVTLTEATTNKILYTIK
ncbi:MAG: PD40 domain-containing protein [Bacteroidales bacterium]|nr:PD40 domain-containing protein [Bacteroidales bacterium]